MTQGITKDQWNATLYDGKQGFVSKFGEKGNVESITSSLIEEIHAILPNHEVSFPWYYPSIAEYIRL